MAPAHHAPGAEDRAQNRLGFQAYVTSCMVTEEVGNRTSTNGMLFTSAFFLLISSGFLYLRLASVTLL